MQKGKIYKITNKITEQIYVGCTIYTLDRRFNEHVYRCFKTDYNSKLYNSMKKYGKENFTIDLIEECDLEVIYSTEKKYIEQYDSYSNGLNSTLGGEGCLGYKHSYSVRKKISEKVKNGNSHKGKTYLQLYGISEKSEKIKRSNAGKNYWKTISKQEKEFRLKKTAESIEKRSKFTNEVKILIKKKLNDGVTINKIIEEYPNISSSMLYAIKLGYRWKNIKI